eukprot:scaffold3001_cov122-Cylindrotheca_fusiformis.AAC.10
MQKGKSGATIARNVATKEAQEFGDKEDQRQGLHNQVNSTDKSHSGRCKGFVGFRDIIVSIRSNKYFEDEFQNEDDPYRKIDNRQ